MSTYELTITPDYVPDWTIVDAVREFIQNAQDQETLNYLCTMSVDYNEDKQLLSITSELTNLTRKSLLLGQTTKRDNNRTIGQFGEGYKIATLVALRTGHPVTIRNEGQNEVWAARFIKSRRYESLVLAFDIEAIVEEHENTDLIIRIENITYAEYAAIQEMALVLQGPQITYDTMYGQVLREPYQAGRIYVDGLFITKDDDLKYGYNFPASDVRLDRDRRMISTFETQWQTSRIWIQTGAMELLDLAREGVPDIAYIGSLPAEWDSRHVLEQAYVLFREQYGPNAIPVTTQHELEQVMLQYQNAIPIITTVPERWLIEHATDYCIMATEKDQVPVSVRLQLFYDAHKDYWSLETCRELEGILSDLRTQEDIYAKM